jgi:hypothetical protein
MTFGTRRYNTQMCCMTHTSGGMCLIRLLTSTHATREDKELQHATTITETYPYVVTNRNVKCYIVHYICSLVYYCFSWLINGLIWFPLLMQIELLHHVRWSLCPNSSWYTVGSGLLWKHSIVPFTKERDKVCQALRALTCCTTDDVHHGASQASVGPLSCTRVTTSNCKYCILNVRIYIYLKEMSFSNMKNCNSVWLDCDGWGYRHMYFVGLGAYRSGNFSMVGYHWLCM